MRRRTDILDNAKGFTELLNYAALVDDGIILNKDGSFLAGIIFRGVDISSSTKSERNHVARQMNQALSSLGTGYMTHIDSRRFRVSPYSPPEASHFPHPVFKMMDDTRRAFFEGDNARYETQCVLWVTYMPPSKNLSRLTDLVFEAGDITRTSPARRNLARFRDKMNELEGRLKSFLHIERLRAYRHGEFWRDNLLAHVNATILGKLHPIQLPETPMYLDSLFGAYDFWTGLKPKLDKQYLCCISIDGFPDFSSPNMLTALDYLPVEYRWSTRFCYYDSSEAIKHLQKEQKKWKQKVVSFRDKLLRTANPKVDEDALDMVRQYDAAITAASKADVKYGHYTSTIIIRNSDIEQLELDVEEVANCLRNTMGFSCRIETVNAVEAFLGTLPSDSLHNVRRPLVSTLNLAHLSPLSSLWGGSVHCPCPFYPDDSPPLMYCVAEGNTPFRLNLHVRDVGHTLIFGPIGAGKSTLLAEIVAQFMRYKDAHVFAFDKGKSLFAVSQAGGKHYAIGEPGSPTFAPLADLDNDFEWCENYIEHLLLLQGVEVDPPMRKKINVALSGMRGLDNQTMSEFYTQVQDETIKSAIGYYTHDQRCGDLLDAEHDSTQFSHLQVFEIEELMNRGDKDLIAVLLYLFRKIERSLKGQPSMIIIDEAWMALGHPVFRDMIREWLKVLRKANCIVIMATQSLSDAVKSGMLDVMIESCPSKIFLPNPYAEDDLPRKNYEQFGLNNRQISIIKNATPKRQYYVTSPEGNRLISLTLSPLELAFVGISEKPELKALRECIQIHKDDWYVPWLSQRGVK